MKEGCSQEEHQQQYIWYLESNAIGCNRRGRRCNRRDSRCNRRGSHCNAKAGFHLTAVEHLNGAVIKLTMFTVSLYFMERSGIQL